MAWEEQVIGACRLIRGDAHEVLPILEKVDVVVTDPPYGVALQQKKTSRGHGRSGDVIRRGTYSLPDTPAYVAEVVVPLIEQCRSIASCIVVTPGSGISGSILRVRIWAVFTVRQVPGWGAGVLAVCNQSSTTGKIPINEKD